MSIKGRKIFIYNNHSDKEINAVIKLIINVEEIMQDEFIYKIF